MDEAVRLLDRFHGEAKVLAGGQSLLPLLKLRLARPSALVDLQRIGELTGIREEGDSLHIGAMTRTADLGASPVIRERYALLADAAAVIADPLVRNMGTVGGNLSHGDPANDLPACMMALDAVYSVTGPGGPRTVAAREFYRDTFATALEDNEILTEARVPRARPRQGGAYRKLERRAGDFPIVGVAANLVLAQDGSVQQVGLGLTAVGPTALDAHAACEFLLGKPLDADGIHRAAELARDLSRPATNLQGTAEYKRAMLERLTREALDLAHRRARGGA